MGAERRAGISNFKSGSGGFHGDGSLSVGGTSNQASFQASQGTKGDNETVKSVEDKDSKIEDPHDRGVVAISIPDKLVDLTVSGLAMPLVGRFAGKGKRKLEEGGPSKEESTQRKKSKSAIGMKTQEDKNDTEDTEKDGSKMEMDESGGEEIWKDEDVGVDEDEAEDVSDQDSPIHSSSLGNVNSQPMVEKDDKANKEKEMDSEREMNKEPEK
ncbi:uncharacterized protein LOC131034269 [Cryptomeria japonica]|uniref:uncharacterized protein LOC131034269 n=1 Tax=Cryptomeria japonica TaxID=3369 RepID=UPI0027DA3347|nr:uncharacterized protein LOC131034269 [Cryptomeria japonica]